MFLASSHGLRQKLYQRISKSPERSQVPNFDRKSIAPVNELGTAQAIVEHSMPIQLVCRKSGAEDHI